MKTKFIILLLLFLSTLSFSQTFKEKRDKIKALKVAYITEKLDLTSEEAQKFWPVYNTYDDKQFEIRHQKGKSIMKKIEATGYDTLTEEEAKKLIVQIEANEEEMYEVKKKFIQDLQKVLPAKKIILLKKSEDEFNRKLLKQFRENHPKK
ncbi:sensor of ECF-type sigma factor [Flavobacterium chuncheonense]|uniref:Sensor of ECF-type sigma factor n=1 Tax=Flavobacterium chuncheonense TaxID=2026653 RepID=A0ABW5YIS1_9FLAO